MLGTSVSRITKRKIMTDKPKDPCCACDVAPKLIFACSGAADVGQISDLAAGKRTAEDAGKMFCLGGS